MMDLKNVLVNYQETSAYSVIADIVNVCGIESVLMALAEIEENKHKDSSIPEFQEFIISERH